MTQRGEEGGAEADGGIYSRQKSSGTRTLASCLIGWLLYVGITAAWTVIPVQLSRVATTDNQAESLAGVVQAANNLQMVATSTVDKYGP